MLKVATVFSGIGAIEHALKRVGLKHEIVFASDNGDINPFEKKIDDNFIEINIEFKELLVLIKDMSENIGKQEFIELKNILHRYKEIYDNICSKLSLIEFDYYEIKFKSIIDNINNMANLNLTRKNNINEYAKEAFDENNTQEGKIYALIKLYNYIMRQFNNEIKDSLNKEMISSKKIYKSELGIEWDLIIEDLYHIKKLEKKINFKKMVSEVKSISDQLTMLHERIAELSVLNYISKLDSYEEKKIYIDNIYLNQRKTNFVKKSYQANYDVPDSKFHWNVKFIDGTEYKDKVDLFVGGSPCQSFSLVGKQRGLEDTRGTLFYDYARLISEIKPKVFIYENVKGILSNDDGKTWDTMKEVFKSLDYDFSYKVLNAKDYGIPQNRERVFVVGFRKDLKLKKGFEFPEKQKLTKTMKDFLVDNVSGKYYLNEKGVKFVTSQKNLNKSFTQINGDIQLCQKKNQQFNWHGDFVFVEEQSEEKPLEELEKYFLSEKVKKYVMSSGTKEFYAKPEIDLDIARPLLTTMHKMHRAGVDNYVTTEGRIRKLTPRETLRLMGFCDSFKIVVSDTQVYQQAGNSIVVDVLIAILDKILESFDF